MYLAWLGIIMIMMRLYVTAQSTSSMRNMYLFMGILSLVLAIARMVKYYRPSSRHARKSKRRRAVSKAVKLVGFCAFVLVMVIGTASFMTSGADASLRNGNIGQAIRQTVGHADETDMYASVREKADGLKQVTTKAGKSFSVKAIDFNAARAMNPDVIAWVYVPGTQVNFPVLKGTQYAHLDFMRNEHEKGAIYADDDSWSIIHGDSSLFKGLQDSSTCYVYTDKATYVYRLSEANQQTPHHVAIDDAGKTYGMLYQKNYQ